MVGYAIFFTSLGGGGGRFFVFLSEYYLPPRACYSSRVRVDLRLYVYKVWSLPGLELGPRSEHALPSSQPAPWSRLQPPSRSLRNFRKKTSEKDTKYSIAHRIFLTCSPFFRFLFRLMRKAGRGSSLLSSLSITVLYVPNMYNTLQYCLGKNLCNAPKEGGDIVLKPILERTILLRFLVMRVLKL